jgi:chromosome segregation ATPase
VGTEADRGVIQLEVRVLALRRQAEAFAQAVQAVERTLWALKRDLAALGGAGQQAQRGQRALARKLAQYRARTDALVALFRALDRRVNVLAQRTGAPFVPLDDEALEGDIDADSRVSTDG